MSAEADLDSQQKHFTSIEFDLRITNLAKFIHRKLGNKKGSFMDIGAGSGLMLKYFMNKGYEVSGIELDNELVKRMHSDPKLKKLNIKQGDITKMQGKEEYDIVVSNDVIEHIEDDKKALKNLWSFVKPGGTLVITVPAHSFLFCQRDKNWGHFRRYDKSDLLPKMKQLGGSFAFITYWNIVGFFVYFLFEHVIKSKMHEEIRYKDSSGSNFVKTIIGKILDVERMLGGVPIGLSLVVGMKKPD